jgi:hypothetical protein
MTAMPNRWYRRMVAGWDGSAAWGETQVVTAPPVRVNRFATELRSLDRSLSFAASFALRWQGEPGVISAVKVDLNKWAGNLSSSYCVAQASQLDAELNAQLDRNWIREFEAGTRILGGEARVTVDPEVLAAYTEMQTIKRRAAVERLRWETDLEELRFLRENVFSRPDVARSYWLNRHLDKPAEFKAVPFDEIAEAFAPAAEESLSVRITGVVEEFLSGLDDGQRRYLLGQLEKIFRSYDRPELADRVGSTEGDGGPESVPE